MRGATRSSCIHPCFLRRGEALYAQVVPRTEKCQQGGIAGAMHLVSLMGCNIYDEHDKLAPAEDLSEEDQTQVLSM